LRHGSSDLALYHTITRGIPGTPMLKRDLTSESAWDIVVFLKDIIAANSAARDDVSNETSSRRALPSGFHVTFEQLKAAADDSAEWLIYSGTYDGHRHSRLSQITPGNVGRLRIKWLFQFPKNTRVVENTPLVVGNTMFISSPPSDVWALDTRTGEKLWSYSSPTPLEVRNTTSVNRGLAISGNTLYLGTLNAHLVALNAQRGTLLWDVKVAENNDGYGITSAPLALRDQVIVGVAGGDGGIRGFLDAYSPTTGKRIWRFYTVPGPGEPGHETWGGGASWKRGSAPTWLTGSYDPQLDLVYWGVGNPGPDYQGDVRPGANLYSNSVIALEAATGRLHWYYQFTPHDEHDWDAAQIPILADAMFDGQPRKLMYWANRNGFYYVLDRTTGRFLRAKAFVKQTWAAGFDSAGVPIQRPEGHPTREGALIFPNVHGGTNWWSPSYDPASNTIYVPTMEGADIYIKGPAIALPDGGYLGGVVGAQDPEIGGQPTWTAVRALDASTGQLRWEYRFPPRHPSIVMGGLLSTDGGLVFGGDEALFVGLDARQGRELWRFNVGNDIAAAPITYLVDGRQYITVAAGITILTFALD
jgi:alcohol dehydrogenase (cytochrome c)